MTQPVPLPAGDPSTARPYGSGGSVIFAKARHLHFVWALSWERGHLARRW